MSQLYELHVGDVGTEIRLQLTDSGQTVDLSQLTDSVIVIRRPDGTTVELAAAAGEDPTRGELSAEIQADTLSVAGVYQLQARLDLGLWAGHSSAVRFRVLPALTQAAKQ